MSLTYTALLPPPYNPPYQPHTTLTLIGLIPNKNLSQLVRTNYPQLVDPSTLTQCDIQYNPVMGMKSNDDHEGELTTLLKHKPMAFAPGDYTIPSAEYPLLMKQYRRVVPLKTASTISEQFTNAQINDALSPQGFLNIYCPGETQNQEAQRQASEQHTDSTNSANMINTTLDTTKLKTSEVQTPSSIEPTAIQITQHQPNTTSQPQPLCETDITLSDHIDITRLDQTMYSFVLLGPVSHFVKKPNLITTLPITAYIPFYLPVIDFHECNDQYKWNFHTDIWPLGMNPKKPDENKILVPTFSKIQTWIHNTILNTLINYSYYSPPLSGQSSGISQCKVDLVNYIPSLKRIGAPHSALVFDNINFQKDCDELIHDLQQKELKKQQEIEKHQDEVKRQQQKEANGQLKKDQEKEKDGNKDIEKQLVQQNQQQQTQQQQQQKKRSTPKPKPLPLPNLLDHKPHLLQLVSKHIISIATDHLEPDGGVEYCQYQYQNEQQPKQNEQNEQKLNENESMQEESIHPHFFMGSQFSRLPLNLQINTMNELPISIQHATMQCVQQVSAVAAHATPTLQVLSSEMTTTIMTDMNDDNISIGNGDDGNSDRDKENKDKTNIQQQQQQQPIQHLCNNYDLYLTHEPCNMCSMGAVHSRFERIFFIHTVPHGTLTTLFPIQHLPKINHKYQVFQVSLE